MPLNALHWDDIEWNNVRDGVDRKAISGESVTGALHRLMPGCETNPHQHPHEQIAYIISGKVDFHVGDDVVRPGPRRMAVVPANTMHHALVIGDEPVINLDIFTPRRPEYA